MPFPFLFGLVNRFLLIGRAGHGERVALKPLQVSHAARTSR